MKNTKKSRLVADKTRKSILKAAKSLFVKQGFAATSINQIASKANINKSLLYHHFQNKENLWRIVQDHIIENYEEELTKIFNNKNLSGKEVISRFLNMRIEIGTRSPEIQKMFYWLYLEGNTALRRGRKFGIDRWLNLIESLQKNGELRQDLSPRLIMVLLSAQANGLLNFINDLNDLELRKKCIEVSELMLLKTLLPENKGDEKIR